ncbi:hypothetical protein CR513_36372, partial [Mucuna pruriens]
MLLIHERNYPTHDLELAAVVFILKIWRPEGFKVLEVSKETEFLPFISLQGFMAMIPLSSWEPLLSPIDDAGENPSVDTE